MQTHLALRGLNASQRPDKDVQVLFSVSPSGRAMIFIHGFSGDATKTWVDFPSLAPRCHKCADCDLFFYGYDGLRADMTASAALFREFLERLFSHSSQLANNNLPASMQRQATFAYTDLTIVAHSLGAVIARRALLDATTTRLPWVGKTKLVLYAPAHMGASVAKLAIETATALPFLRWFSGPARFTSPLIDQLSPDSPELKDLLQETQAACAGGANAHLIAKRVIIAEYENIVTNRSFAKDPPPITIPNTSHTSVCKPKAGFLYPLSHLEDCL